MKFFCLLVFVDFNFLFSLELVCINLYFFYMKFKRTVCFILSFKNFNFTKICFFLTEKNLIGK